MTGERGCGRRQAGGIYAELGLSPFGSPLEHFMLCPPIPVDPKALGLSARGVKLFQRAGIWHILDWVGTNHYPNPTDDLEEIRRMGMSARLELSSPEEYAKLSSDSRIMRVHAHAYITNPRDYWKNRRGNMTTFGYDWNFCPKGHALHIQDPYLTSLREQPPMCIGLLYEDIILGRKIENCADERTRLREMPSFEYYGYAAPETAEEIQYEPAIYASFPIQRLVVVKDKVAGSHIEKSKRLKNTRLFDNQTGFVEE